MGLPKQNGPGLSGMGGGAMKKWWSEHREEFLAGVFLFALLLLSVGIVLSGLDDQAARQERRISLMWRG